MKHTLAGLAMVYASSTLGASAPESKECLQLPEGRYACEGGTTPELQLLNPQPGGVYLLHEPSTGRIVEIRPATGGGYHTYDFLDGGQGQLIPQDKDTYRWRDSDSDREINIDFEGGFPSALLDLGHPIANVSVRY